MWNRACAKPPRKPPDVTSGAERFPPRLFGTEDEVRRVAGGLLACTLPRADWTHEGHLAAVSALVLEHPELHLEQALPGIIARYNVSVGGINDDTQGYHETITQFWLANARAFHATHGQGDLLQRVNRFIGAAEGRREAPMRFFSPARLFSVEARRALVEPDLMPFDWNPAEAGHHDPRPA